MSIRVIDVNTMLGVTNTNDLVRDEDVIVNAIINVIMIPKRSSKFRPGRGSSIHLYLQGPVSPITALRIQNSLMLDLQAQVRYAEFGPNDVRVKENATGTGYLLTVNYVSRINKQRGTATLNLFAQQG